MVRAPAVFRLAVVLCGWSWVLFWVLFLVLSVVSFGAPWLSCCGWELRGRLWALASVVGVLAVFDGVYGVLESAEGACVYEWQVGPRHARLGCGPVFRANSEVGEP